MFKKIPLDFLEQRPTVDACIQYLGDLFPELKQFKDTPQDPIWHAEGNVHIHTDMVLQELYKIFDTEEFVPSPEEYRNLVLAALLHDIAKPLVTREVDGRIKASRHEEVGRNLVVHRLGHLEGLSTSDIILITNLVGYHQRPKLLAIKDEIDAEYIKLFLNIKNPELMYWLEMADLRGRTCEDKEESIMHLDEWFQKTKNILARLEEEGKTIQFEKHFKTKDTMYLLANNLIKSKHEASTYRYAAWSEDKRFYVTLLCGLPGSGKTTFYQNYLQNSPNVISLDTIRSALGKHSQDFSNENEVLRIARKKFLECLRKKENVVYDATNIREDSRNALLTLAHNYGALTRIYVLIPTLDQIIENDKERFHSVGEDVIRRKAQRFQLPHCSEASIVTYLT